jgi:hypothetical protein
MKQPKKIIINWYPITVHRTWYICPFCHTQVFEEIDKNVVRFKCYYCKNELIINGYKEEKAT